MMIDIGLNLTNSRFRNDTEQVINSALAVNVGAMIVTGTNIEQSQNAQQLTQEYPHCLYATAGIHPHDASTFSDKSVTQLQTLLNDKKVVAVGECGLDFNRNFSTPAEQLSCFEIQLELAVELQMPVFLHQRDANDNFLQLIKKYRSGLVGAVAHCFTGGQKELESYLQEDLHVGITGWLCDERRGQELRDCVNLIPVDKVMVETDAPYLFPRNYKLPDEDSLSSKQKKKIRSRNEPQYLPYIIEALANLMMQDKDVIAQMMTKNAQRFFRL